MGSEWTSPAPILSTGSVEFNFNAYGLGGSAGQTHSAIRTARTGGRSQFIQIQLDNLFDASEFYIELINFIVTSSLARRVGYLRGAAIDETTWSLAIGTYGQLANGDRVDEQEWSDPDYQELTNKLVRFESFPNKRQRVTLDGVAYIDTVAITPINLGRFQGLTMWWE